MKFTGKKWGTAAAVIVSAGGIGWRATSGPSNAEVARSSMPLSLAALAQVERTPDDTLTSELPGAGLHSLVSVGSAQPAETQVFDKPQGATDTHKLMSDLAESLGSLVDLQQSSLSVLPDDISSIEVDYPEAPVSILTPVDPSLALEAEARGQVVDMLGGEAQLFAQESDMAYAYAAARSTLSAHGIPLATVSMLAVIDFTLPSFDRRLALYHPSTGEESRHLVAHGQNTGELYAEYFSNTPRSLQSSPGLYRIGKHYNGEHGAAIRLHGMQKGVNDRAFARDVVIHSAWYVSYQAIIENQLKLGVPRIGRSHGCPAVSKEDLPTVLEKLRPGSYLYIHAEPSVPQLQQQVSANDPLLR